MSISLFIKTSQIKTKEKKEIYFKIMNSFQLPISEDVINEINKRKIFDNDPHYNCYGKLINKL